MLWCQVRLIYDKLHHIHVRSLLYHQRGLWSLHKISQKFSIRIDFFLSWYQSMATSHSLNKFRFQLLSFPNQIIHIGSWIINHFMSALWKFVFFFSSKWNKPLPIFTEESTQQLFPCSNENNNLQISSLNQLHAIINLKKAKCIHFGKKKQFG